MVTVLESGADLRQRAWDAAAGVVDPEIPVLTIADLGVLRDVVLDGDHVEVAITPTYSGCPAMNMIGLEIEVALERAGFRGSKVRTVGRAMPARSSASSISSAIMFMAGQPEYVGVIATSTRPS